MKFYYTTLTKLKTKAIAFLLILFSMQGVAQTDLSSPYSIYGPGIAKRNLTVSQFGMGGSGVAMIDQYKMNYLNPAALAYYLEPIFETSGLSTISKFKTNTGSFDNKSFELNNLSLSFPIKRGVWGLTIGIKPYSTVGYSVSATAPNPDLPITPIVTYEGNGGLNQGYLGTAYRVYNKTDSTGNTTSLALGGNFNFNFGTIDNNRQLFFPNDPTSVGLLVQESVLVRDINFDFGVQFQTNLIKRTSFRPDYLKFLAGAAYSTGTDLRARKTSNAFNVPTSAGRDTLSTLSDERGTITLPTKITVGIGLDYVSVQRKRFRLALDYSTQEWSTYTENFSDVNTTFDFENSQTYSAGFEFTPQLGSSKYLRTVEYRAGFMYQKSNLKVNDTAINDIGMSFGLTLPLHHRRGLTKSAFHISGQYGTYGTTDNNLIQEDYIKVMVGFSFTPHFRNRWFVQPKYD